MLKLKQALDDFTVNGLPDFPALLTFGDKRENDQECFQIEETWRAFVDKEKLSGMDKKQTDQQEVIWEIIVTEVRYIRSIRIIVDLYLCTLLNLQASVMLNEIETENIFSNIIRIEKLHTRFWKEKLSNVAKKARDEKRLLSVLDLAEAFDGFADLFTPYVTFCTTWKERTEYLREKFNQNEPFRFFLEWAQRHPSSRRLKLRDLLNYPMGRICKYPLLLTAVEKKTLDNQYKAEVSIRIFEVKEFVMRVHQESSLEDEEEEKIAVEDEVCATLNPKTPMRMHHSLSTGSAHEVIPAVVEVPKMLQLQQTLDDLMVNGLQDFPALLTFGSKREDDEECFQIEEIWHAFVDKKTLNELDKKQTDQQEVIWEIIKTEVGFIKDIRIIVDLYSCTLLNLQASILLNEIETEKIFCNIAAIEKVHTRFWKKKLSNVVKKARAEKRLPSDLDLAEAFVGFASLFAPYIKFCSAQNKCMEYLREQIKCNEMFKVFLDWAQRHPDSRTLKLQDLLDYPRQRIINYPLLLTALEKTLDGQGRAELSKKISEVKEFVKQVNPDSRQEDEREMAETDGEKTALNRNAALSSEHVHKVIPDLVEVSKMMRLQQTLNDLMVNGLQDFPALLNFGTKREDDEKYFQIEETWRAFADQKNPSELDENQTDQQEAIWEIITTEVGFIKDIRIIVDLYLCTLLNLQASIMLNEIETEKIFCNISAIEKLHTKFWKEKLSNVVKKARAENRFPSAVDLAESFDGFADLYAPYIKFCTTQNKCMKYLRQQIKDNEMFKVFLDWAQKHPSSRALKLQDLLDYPRQRIVKYPLLLTGLEKTLDGQCRAQLSIRISEVKEFVMRVNPDSRKVDEREEIAETDGVKTTLDRRAAMRIHHSLSNEPVNDQAIPVVVEVPKLLMLQQTLDDFMVNGLQDFPALLAFGTEREDDEEYLQIEETWRAFADQKMLSELDKKQTDQQEVIWEIIITEVGFIKDIRIIVDLYLCSLLNVQASIMLNEIVTETICSNISAIEKLHTRFWKEKLSNVVKKARTEKTLLSALDLAEAFVGFADLFAPYIKFCTARNKSIKYLRQQLKDNEMFKVFLDWAQRHPNSRGLKLQDLLDYPIQRITKYNLLLSSLAKTLDGQGRAEVSTRTAEVKEFVMRVNPNEPVPEVIPDLVEVPHMLKLQQTLDDFMVNGLQDFPTLLTFTTKREDNDECFQIEETWYALTDKKKLGELGKKQTDQQEAIWEIITTELGFIKDIRIIVDLYLCTLLNIQASMMLNEIETEKIFSNITAVEGVHTRFWNEKLSNVVKKARSEKRLPSTLDLAEAFVGFANLFAPYIKYCTAQNKCVSYLKQQIKDNEMFKVFLDWAQRHPDSRTLQLQDLLDYPRQRIIKYPLLLTTLEKTLDGQSRAELSTRISEVKEFAMAISQRVAPETG